MQSLLAELEATEINTTVKVLGRDRDEQSRLQKRTRVYVAGVELLPELVIADAELPDGAGGRRGEDESVDRAYDRRNRLYGQKTREVATLVIQSVAGRDVTVSFSRRAGCSCGCSPGCVADSVIFFQSVPVDIFVELHRSAG